MRPCGACRRYVLELKIECVHARGHINMKRKHIDSVAPPLEPLTVGGDFQSGHLKDRSAWGVIAGQPTRIEQRHGLPGSDRNSLMDAENVSLRVGGVDIERDWPGGIGEVLWRGDRRRQRRGLL